MKLLFLLLLCCLTHARKHSMKVYFTASSGILNLPAVMITIQINDVVTGYCDSKLKRAVPKQDWMQDLIKEDPGYWNWYRMECLAHLKYFNEEFLGLKKRLNTTGDVHILQKLTSCEWNDETDEVSAIHQYGFDGEDFIVFDLETERWLALKSEAMSIKRQWDADRTRTQYWGNFLMRVCAECVKKNVHYGRSSLLRTDLPSVSLLQKSPGSPVNCHATGFYPSSATMMWRKDSQQLQHGVELDEILPNHDGTFQMSIKLNVSSFPLEEWGRYECVFQLPGAQNVIVTRLDRAVIRTNWVPPKQTSFLTIAVAAAGFLLLAVCIGALIICRKKTTDTSSESVFPQQEHCQSLCSNRIPIKGNNVGDEDR